MAAQPAALVIDPAPDLRELLRVLLEDEGYTVQTTPDSTRGLQVLRDSATPLTVLVDVLPLPNLSHAQSGLALLDALAQDSLDGAGLARHGYVLMSTNPEQALALVKRLPPGLRIVPKPFCLDDLCASLEQVAEWLSTHPIPQPYAAATGIGHARLSIETSHRLLEATRARLDRQTDHPPAENR